MSNIIDDFKIAEKGWIEARKLALKIIKPGADVLNVTNEIENEIKKHCEIAFPLNISFNNQAAHFTPISDTKQIINKEDVIKVDIGTHYNGHIVDAAFTIDLSGKYLNICDASKNALNNAIEYIVKNGKDSEHGKIGQIIENEITILNYKPIYNLTGHSTAPYEIHAGTSILNYLTASKKTLGNGTFAIEPFATNGSGYIHEGNQCGIYFYNGRNSRNTIGRRLIEDAKKHNGLPFAERWIGKDIDLGTKKLALNLLVKEGIFKPAPVLEDVKGSIVSQHEKSVYICDNEVHIFPNIDF